MNHAIRSAAVIAAVAIALPIVHLAAQPGGPPPPLSGHGDIDMRSAGARCDGKSDDTDAILAATNRNGRVLIVPANCKFDRVRLVREMPSQVVVFDVSAINDFAAPGETTKSIGILSSDSAPNDTHWLVGSGHHPIINLNNYGSADSQSAKDRKASILWSAGQFAQGGDKNGFRGAALWQFGHSAGSDQWAWGLRSLAPWPALAASYEMWAPGQAIPRAGTYRSTGDAIFVSLVAGRTGRAAPPARPGEYTDGTVRWRWVDSADRSLMIVAGNGHVLFGLGDLRATWRHKSSIVDLEDYVAEWAANGPSRDVILKPLPTDARGNETVVPALRASAAQGLSIVRAGDYRTPLVRFDNRRGVVSALESRDGARQAPRGGTLDVSNRRLVFVSGGSGTRIEDLAGGVEGQLVTLHFLDQGATLVDMGRGQIRLQGGSNLSATADTVVHLRKMPDDLGGRWVEEGRSLK